MFFSVAVLVMTSGIITAVPVPNENEKSPNVPLDSEEQLRSLISNENVIDAKITETSKQSQTLEQHQKMIGEAKVDSAQQSQEHKNVQKQQEKNQQKQEENQQKQEEQKQKHQQELTQQNKELPLQKQHHQQQQQQQTRVQQQSLRQQQGLTQQQETHALPMISTAVVDDLVSKINDNIRSRHATISLCRKVHGVYFRGKCIIAKDNIEMVIGSVFSDNLKKEPIHATGFVAFGNPNLQG